MTGECARTPFRRGLRRSGRAWMSSGDVGARRPARRAPPARCHLGRAEAEHDGLLPALMPRRPEVAGTGILMSPRTPVRRTGPYRRGSGQRAGGLGLSVMRPDACVRCNRSTDDVLRVVHHVPGSCNRASVSGWTSPSRASCSPSSSACSRARWRRRFSGCRSRWWRWWERSGWHGRDRGGHAGSPRSPRRPGRRPGGHRTRASVSIRGRSSPTCRRALASARSSSRCCRWRTSLRRSTSSRRIRW
jgi:hypothetical protein